MFAVGAHRGRSELGDFGILASCHSCFHTAAYSVQTCRSRFSKTLKAAVTALSGYDRSRIETSATVMRGKGGRADRGTLIAPHLTLDRNDYGAHQAYVL